MKARIVVCTLLFGGALLPIGLMAQDRGGGKIIGGPAGVKAPYNPKPFQNFVVSPSAPIRFLLSDTGKQLLRQSPSPKARELLKMLGEDVSAATAPSAPAASLLLQPPPPGRGPRPADPGTVSVICPAGTGCNFNLEPSTSFLPQNEETVDLILSGASGNDLVVEGSNDYRGFVGELGGSVTGYYVNRDGDGPAEFEGGLPAVADPLKSGNFLAGGGDPVVAADPNRGAFFMADLRFDSSTTGIGVFRTTSANLLSTTNCPAGTHTAAQAATCWPTERVINPLPGTCIFDVAYCNDKPHLAVDERATGTGAGDVYITATEFDFFQLYSRIWLVACKNDLSQCSAPILISGYDTATQFSHVSVRPDGGITITYINVTRTPAPDFAQNFEIKYVRCTPGIAPSTPSCAPAVLVHNETQPLPFGGFLAAQDLRIATYPKHDHRVDGTGTETYVVWDRCKVPLLALGPVGTCPDADVVMKGSNNNGLTWSALANVNVSSQDQFFPWIRTDRSRNIVNIDYYTSQADSVFQHRVQVYLNHINPDGVLDAPDPITDTHIMTTSLDDPSSDPVLGGGFFGDYIGVAARGNGQDGASRAYAGYTYNEVQKSCGAGVTCPQQDNHLQRLDY